MQDGDLQGRHGFSAWTESAMVLGSLCWIMAWEWMNPPADTRRQTRAIGGKRTGTVTEPWHAAADRVLTLNA